MPTLFHVSPYDVPNVRPDDPVLSGAADESALRQIADTGLVAVPIDTNWRDEARRLNDRWNALCIWTMPTEMHEVIADGVRRWFAAKRRGVPRTLDGAGHALRVAYAVARSKVQSDVRFDLVRENLVLWIYTGVMPEPSRETVEA